MTNLNSIAGFGAGGGDSGGGAEVALHSGTPVSEMLQFDRTGNDNREPYSYTAGIILGACPNGNIKSRNVFGAWAQWRDTGSANQTGYTVSSFSINRSTGALSILQSGPQDIWVNSSGSGISTTYTAYDAVHGCFFSGGHNCYPGNSGHVFGNTYGQLTTTGSINGGGYNVSNSDHSYNGSFCGALNQGTGTQYFLTGGYGPTSKAGHRQHTATSSGITVGGWADDGNWTSSSGGFRHIFQPDQVVTSGDATSVHGTSFNTPDYGLNIMRGSSKTTANLVGGSSTGTCITGAGGTTFIHQSNSFYGTLGNGSNNLVSLVDGDRDMGSHTHTSLNSTHEVGIGQNKVLYFRHNHAAFDGGTKAELVGFESNQNPKRLGHLTMGEVVDKSILDTTTTPQHYGVVFENDNDTYPKWLYETSSSGGRYISIKVYEITADFSAFTI